MLWLVLLLCLSLCSTEYEYQHYNLSSLCGEAGSVVPLYLGRQESVFHIQSPHRGVEECHLRLRVFSDFYGQAVFIKKMRSDSCDSDYLQFGRSSFLGLAYDKSQKYCETIDLPTEVFSIDGSLHDMDFGSSPFALRSYVEEHTDQMDVWISLSPQTQAEQDSVSFVVTPFAKMCMEHDAIYRQCPGSHSCVRRQLFCDGVVNCPHAWQESEETDCKFPHLRGGAFNNFPVTFLVMFLILTLGSLALLAWKVRWDNTESRKLVLQEEHDRIEKHFRVKVKKKKEDEKSTEASTPPFDNFLQEFYRFSALQARDCTKVEIECDQ